ncbi:hypothetical protein A4D02_27435 [Niastella koreensis]|uniref:Secreted protein n=1 Tax=Niastella koreensis TaxID=354356 RepID=A0ABX3P088_9BACT|nr:hypothetical protein A4D02_27435 [Niastella koreensis]
MPAHTINITAPIAATIVSLGRIRNAVGSIRIGQVLEKEQAMAIPRSIFFLALVLILATTTNDGDAGVYSPGNLTKCYCCMATALTRARCGERRSLQKKPIRDYKSPVSAFGRSAAIT